MDTIIYIGLNSECCVPMFSECLYAYLYLSYQKELNAFECNGYLI